MATPIKINLTKVDVLDNDVFKSKITLKNDGDEDVLFKIRLRRNVNFLREVLNVQPRIGVVKKGQEVVLDITIFGQDSDVLKIVTAPVPRDELERLGIELDEITDAWNFVAKYNEDELHFNTTDPQNPALELNPRKVDDEVSQQDIMKAAVEVLKEKEDKIKSLTEQLKRRTEKAPEQPKPVVSTPTTPAPPPPALVYPQDDVLKTILIVVVIVLVFHLFQYIFSYL